MSHLPLSTLLPLLLNPSHSSDRNEGIPDLPALLEVLSAHSIKTAQDILGLALSVHATSLPSETRALVQAHIMPKVLDFLSSPATAGDVLYKTEQARKASTHALGIRTGCKQLDETLALNHKTSSKEMILPGELVEIVGHKAAGKTFLALQTVLRYLAADPSSYALWLDTTGTFSPERGLKMLEEIIRERREDKVPNSADVHIQGVKGAGKPSETTLAAENNADQGDATHSPDVLSQSSATSILDRLIISKVFHLNDAVEAIQSIRRDGFPHSAKPENAPESPDIKSNPSLQIPPHAVKARVDNDRDTMDAQENNDATFQAGAQGSEGANRTVSKDLKLAFLVLDSIPVLFRDILSNVTAQGHAKMLTFSRLLRSLANSNPPTTVLVINSLVTTPTPTNNLSVFPRLEIQKLRPGLGPSFTYLTDKTIAILDHEEVFGAIENEGSEDRTQHKEKRVIEIWRNRNGLAKKWTIVEFDGIRWLPLVP